MINLERERLEIPIYFSNDFDFEGMKEVFERDLEDLNKRFIIKNGEILDKS